MKLYNELVNKNEKLSLVGLGYVGMPIAVAFGKKLQVIGFDLNTKKIELYKKGIDPTHEVGDEVVSNSAVEFTADATKLREAKFHIVAVPTPVNNDHTPELRAQVGFLEGILEKGRWLYLNLRFIRVLQKIYAFLFWKGNRDYSVVLTLKLDILRSVLTPETKFIG